ncbi:MAG: ABC transporter substrate-binding protein [Rhodospirillaceae bacterium]|nr:ABC transporter substrate-binding protein [Rhodospirillaceae bacterium]
MLRNAARAACAAIVAVPLLAAAPAWAERFTVSQYGILVPTLPYAVALEKGFFKEEGLDIDGIIQSHGGGTSVRNMMASDLPAAEMALPAAIAAAKQGIKIRIVADDANTIGELVWVAKKGSPVKSIADLKGKKAAFTSPRGVTEIIIKTVLKRHGLLGQTDTVAAGGVGAAVTALNQGAVDAATLVDPVLTRRGADYQVVFSASKELPDLSWAVFVTTDEFLQKNEDKIRRILRARAKAVDFIYANPDETAKIYAKRWNIGEAEAKAILPKFYEMRHWKRGEFNMKGFATMLEGMELVGALEKGYDVKPLLDPRFQAMLKEKP